MNKRPYSYSILRYVHDVVTGEFVNVGIVLFAPSTVAGQPGALRFNFKERIGRIRSLFPDLDRLAFQSAIAAITSRAKVVAKEVERTDLFVPGGNALSIAHRILNHDGSSLQWSDVGSGIASDLDATFDRIALRMTSIYDTHQEARRTDDDVWRPIRQALVDREVSIQFVARTIHGSVDAIEFKHSWVNGKIHAYEPLSFDLADASNIKDKARKWSGHLSSAYIDASEEFKAYFIAGKPSDPNLMDAYETAIEILRNAQSSPQVYEEDQIDDLVNVIEDSYRFHLSHN